MKVPITWLKEMVSFRAGPDQLAQMLTMVGLETTVLPGNILEIDVLPNRSDALSVRGVAREVAALVKSKIQNSKSQIKEISKNIKEAARVEVRDKNQCPRYMARVIENVKITESPPWLKERLDAAGLRPINNVVDVTNYLLLELGQPMHAFDAKLIKDQTMVVRRANPQEKVVTLDGKEHELDSEVLVIADPQRVIAIAGVMGAGNTEVNPKTTTILLESAFFDPISIHRTSKRLKLRTESSIRFEHGVDWSVVAEALDRGAAMIAELGKGWVLRGKIDVKLKDRKPRFIELRTKRVNQILGTEILPEEMVNILKRLGFIIAGRWSRRDGRFKVGIPLFRAMDIEREIDLIEEIARLYGYGKIKATLPKASFFGKRVDQEDQFRNRVREAMLGSGLTEIQTNSLLGPKDFEKTKIPSQNTIQISNPLNVEESILRTSMLPGLLHCAQYNLNRQMENIFIFEIGKVFFPSGEKLPEERWKLGGVMVGSPFLSALDKGEVDYFYVKGVLENLFRQLKIELPKVQPVEDPLLQPAKGAEIEGIGIFGSLHPDLQRNYEFSKPAMIFEMDLDELFKPALEGKRYVPLPKFPFVSRDISMFVPAGLENQKIVEVIKNVGGEWVEQVFPFDRYKDSIAYRVIYRDPNRTLTEEEVNTKHQEIIQTLTYKLMVRIR